MLIITVVSFLFCCLLGCKAERKTDLSLDDEKSLIIMTDNNDDQSVGGESSEDSCLDESITVSVINENKKCLNINFISQLPNYPTGCEGVSAVMVLKRYGVITTPDIFFERYLSMGSFPFDPYIEFGGNPYDNTGIGCYASALEIAMNKALRNSSYKAKTFYGYSMDYLCRNYIDDNIPVIIWATVDMSEKTFSYEWYHNGKHYEWISPEHCLVLVGYDEDNYIFNDPLIGKNTRYERGAVEKAYSKLGKQAIIIER